MIRYQLEGKSSVLSSKPTFVQCRWDVRCVAASRTTASYNIVGHGIGSLITALGVGEICSSISSRSAISRFTAVSGLDSEGRTFASCHL